MVSISRGVYDMMSRHRSIMFDSSSTSWDGKVSSDEYRVS